MPKVINTFRKGVMNKSTDKSLVPQDMFIDAENLRFSTTENNDGIGTSIKGSLEVSNITGGNSDYKCICAVFNEKKDTIFYFLATTNGESNRIIEYDVNTGNSVYVVKDDQGVFNFNKNRYITGVNVVDDLLIWSEWGNSIRKINIERAKEISLSNGVKGFEDDDINLIVKPPFNKPTINLQTTTSDSQEENNIEEKFIVFAYRWRYKDGEYSALSPFTLPAFEPKDFEYDFSVQSNKSMINKYNQVEIGFDTGGKNVTEIQLVFKESGDNEVFIINDFVKELMDDGNGWGHNETKTFNFNNFNGIRGLSKVELKKLFDNVPREALCQTMIDGRLIFANYKENYDIVDSNQNKINIDYSVGLETYPNKIRVSETPISIEDYLIENLTHITTPNSLVLNLIPDKNFTEIFYIGDPITLTGENAGSYTITSLDRYNLELTKNNLPYPLFNGVEENASFAYLGYENKPSLKPKPTAKSNRDYEIVAQYLDEYLRGTTLLKSLDNTIFIPNNLSVNQNSFQVTLKNKPPYFAKYLRFFIKQSKKGYEQVIPSVFYEDGVYTWVKLEESDIDKIQKGNYLIAKSDSEGNKNINEKVKVIEVSSKEANFLENTESTEIKQLAGTYFKIKASTFRLNLDDLELHESIIYTTNSLWWVGDNNNYIYEAIFYGTSNLDDLTSGGTFTGSEDIRYTVEIDTKVGSLNTFKWFKNGGSAEGTEISITPGSPISLDNGVEITFLSDSDHDIGDRWVISAKSNSVWTDTGHSYGFFPSIENEEIKGNANISLIYDEYHAESQYVALLGEISPKKYKNLEEWFFESGIENKLSLKGIDSDRIIFRNGKIENGFFNQKSVDISDLQEESTIMIIRSLGVDNNALDKDPKVKSIIEISQSDNNIILETEAKETPSDIFYEIGKTYKIENGFHLGDGVNDIDQTVSTDLKVKLDWFNAFSYGNGVESYKIKDEFNATSIDVGTRVSSTSKEEYKEVIRTEDITWGDVYSNDGTFNGLNSFNVSLINFITLDRENGSIQKIYNKNGNLVVLQEDGIGRLPYNKNIIYDTQGGSVVGISENILDKKSYFDYGAGKHGISKNPESFISDGFRDYFTDKQRGVLIRLSVDGVTPISKNMYQNEFSNLMISNKNNKLVGGFDIKHEEYLLHLPSENYCLSFKEGSKGFSNKFTFEPDFMLNANNEFYCWKNGVMYKMNATENYNNFFGVQSESKIKFLVNHQFGFEKIFKAIGIYSTHPWLTKLSTSLSSREITKDSFRKMNNHWFSEIMGDTSDNIKNNSIYGLGSYQIVNGAISVLNIPASLSVGDFIRSKTLNFTKSKVLNIDLESNIITIENNLTETSSFLIFEKNQNIDGGNIKGDFMEIELISNEIEKVEIRSVKTEVGIVNRD